MSAIVRRAFDLRVVSPSQYVYANRTIRTRGWHLGEPDEPDDEPQELLPNAFDLLASRKDLRPADVARTLRWRPRLLEEIAGFLSVPSAPRRRGVIRRMPQIDT